MVLVVVVAGLAAAAFAVWLAAYAGGGNVPLVPPNTP